MLDEGASHPPVRCIGDAICAELEARREAFKAQRDSAVARVSPRTLGPWSTAEAPADFVETSNPICLPCNAKQAVDQQFARWVMLHVQSNPLPMCTRSRGPIMGKLT